MPISLDTFQRTLDTGKVQSFVKLSTDGVDVKTVASLMGHADATVTLNVYASADPTARQQAADVVAEAMAERAPKGPFSLVS